MASPLILEVTRSIDDNCEVNNGNSNNASLSYIRLDASVPYGSAMFNTDASEIKGTTITSATFRLKGWTAGGLTLNARVYADKANAPADNNTGAAYDISTRTKTTAYTTITGTLNTSAYSTWDISNVIQELADNPSWDGTIFLILHRQADTCYAGAYDGSRPPQLDIAYTSGGSSNTSSFFAFF